VSVVGTGVATRAAKEKQLWRDYVGSRISLSRTSKMGRYSEGNLTTGESRVGVGIYCARRTRHGFETASGMGAKSTTVMFEASRMNCLGRSLEMRQALVLIGKLSSVPIYELNTFLP
jgi:hypothetical protein